MRVYFIFRCGKERGGEFFWVGLGSDRWEEWEVYGDFWMGGVREGVEVGWMGGGSFEVEIYIVISR
jgi:hypothetical protein